MKRALALVALTLAAASFAAPGRPPVSLAGKLPRTVTVAKPFSVTLVVRRPARPPVSVVARKGADAVRSVARKTRGRYVARVTLSAAGRWTLSARAGKRDYRLGAVVARAPVPVAPALELVRPAGITTRIDGSLLVAEGGANRVVRIDPDSGALAVFAGRGGEGPSGDGGPATQADMRNPFGVAVSRQGDVYVTTDNRVRRIDSAGVISTLFVAPSDTGPITVDGSGDVFFSTATHIYRIIAATGAVVVYAGTGVPGGAGDGGPAVSAQLDTPHGLLISIPDGALLVADTQNRRIRRIDPVTRVITTVATGIAGLGMCHGPNGDPYIVDFATHTLKRLDGSTLTVIAGNGVQASSGDGRRATDASLDTPGMCAVSGATGNLYIVEGGGSGRIRVVNPAGIISTLRRRA